MAELNAKVKNIKRNLILEEALLMFEEFGYEDIKISDLAKKVGVSVGTIYSYFKSKDELYSACVDSEIKKAYEISKELFAQDISNEEKIKRAINIKLSIIGDKKKSLASGAFNNPFFFEAHQMQHKDTINEIYKFYIQPIDELKEVDIESIQLVYILNSLSNAYILRWIEGDIESLQDVDEEIFSVFMSILKGCK